MKKSTLIMIIATVAAVLIGMAVFFWSIILGGGGSTGGEPTWDPDVLASDDPDVIFTKTVNDFPGYKVQNLDDDESTNFVVYAKDAIEITITDTKNVLVSKDESLDTYVFSNPDRKLSSLEIGDVFYGIYENDPTKSVAIKVAGIKKGFNKVTVYGTEAALDELFYYVDVDMAVSPDDMIISDVPEGVTLEKVSTSTASRDTGASVLSLSTTSTDQSSDADAIAEDTVGVLKNTLWEGSRHIDFGTKYCFGAKFTLSPVSDPKRFGFDGIFGVTGNAMATLDIFYNLTSADVRWKFFAPNEYYDVGVIFHGTNGYDVSVGGSGSVYAKIWMGRVNVPLPSCPILIVTGQLHLLLEAEGSITGGLEVEGDVDLGLIASLPKDSGPKMEPIADYKVKRRHLDIQEFEASLFFGAHIDIEESIYKFATVSEYYKAGVAFSGAMKVQDTPLDDPDSIHGCELCVDGSVDVKGTGGVSFDIGINKNKRWVNARVSFPELTFHIADFYLSLIRNGEFDPEFDWTSCPHEHFRTQVYATEGDRVHHGTKVTLESENGHIEDAMIQSNDGDVVYMPAGNVKITAVDQLGNTVEMTGVIPEGRGELTVDFESELDIFILCYYRVAYQSTNEWGDPVTSLKWGTPDDIPQLTSALRSAFPEAKIIDTSGWRDRFGKEVSAYDQNYWNDNLLWDGYSGGDIVIVCEAYRDGKVYFIELGKTPDGQTIEEDMYWNDIAEVYLTAYHTDTSVSVEIAQADKIAVTGGNLLNWWNGYVQFSNGDYDERISLVQNYNYNSDGAGYMLKKSVLVSERFHERWLDEYVWDDSSEDKYLQTSPVRADVFIRNKDTYVTGLINDSISLMKPIIDVMVQEERAPTGATIGELLG